jgi:hypothetical protein
MKRYRFATPLILIVLMLSQAEANGDLQGSNTLKAWDSSTVNQPESDEFQALFGNRVIGPNHQLNWSQSTTPTNTGTRLGISPWIYYALPPCTEEIKLGCISGVKYKLSNGEWKDALLSNRQLPSRVGESFEAGWSDGKVVNVAKIVEENFNADLHNPSAGVASYWDFVDAPHGGGNQYLIRANIAGVNTGAATFDGKFQRYLELDVFPLNGMDEYLFPENLEIKLQLRLGNVAKDLWGWFFGRVMSPEIVLDPSTEIGLLEISGFPSKVPIGLSPKRKFSELGASFQPTPDCPGGKLFKECGQVLGLKSFSVDGNASHLYLDFIEKEVGEIKTIAYQTRWSIKSTRWPYDAYISDCPNVPEGFVGVVATNATMYSTSSPRWDSKDESFTFEVASPHYGLDGVLNQGTYTLALPLNLAECRWGKDVSKARARVSIISSQGVSQVSATNFSIFKSMIYFNVSGFNFSSPSIKVQIEPSAITIPKTTINPKSTVQIIKKKTIICRKGITTKKVTGTKPICPKGFIKS